MASPLTDSGLSQDPAALHAPGRPFVFSITGYARYVVSFPAFLAGLLVALAGASTRLRFDDPDLWWHLRTGEVIWNTRSIPVVDFFSYTTGHEHLVPQEWLSQTLIYAAYRFGGYQGLMLWLVLMSVTVLLAGFLLCSVYSSHRKAGFAGALVIWFFSTSGLAIRPQMIGYALLIVELLLIHLGRTRNRYWFFALPPLFALWVNCHGSFFLGIVIGVLILCCSFFDFRWGLLGSRRWPSRVRTVYVLALLLSAAMLWLNPEGGRQVFYPVNTMLHQPLNLAVVSEWAPLKFPQPRAVGLAATLGLVFLLVVLSQAEVRLDELLLLAVGAAIAADHSRMAFVFGILAAPVISRLLAECFGRSAEAAEHPWLNGVLLAFSLLLAAWIFPSAASLEQQVEQKSPVRAVQYIQGHHLTGNMLNEYAFGGYLIWAAPDHPVFIDGRADIYEWSGVLQQFVRWESLEEDPNRLLDRHHISFCILASHSPMVRVMALLPAWKQVYSDPVAVIFTR